MPSVAPNLTVTVINSTAVDVSWQVGNCICIIALRANAHKIQSIHGQGQNFDFAHILSIDRHYQMNKRGVVCFSKDRFNLAKIKKNYFCCRRLQNTQNLRQNRLLAKLCLHAKGVEFGENFFQCINL